MANDNSQLTKETVEKILNHPPVSRVVKLIAPDEVPGYQADYSHLIKKNNEKK